MPGMIEAHAHRDAGGISRFAYCRHYTRADPEGRAWPGVTTLDGLVERLRDTAARIGAGKPLAIMLEPKAPSAARSIWTVFMRIAQARYGSRWKRRAFGARASLPASAGSIGSAARKAWLRATKDAIRPGHRPRPCACCDGRMSGRRQRRAPALGLGRPGPCNPHADPQLRNRPSPEMEAPEMEAPRACRSLAPCQATHTTEGLRSRPDENAGAGHTRSHWFGAQFLLCAERPEAVRGRCRRLGWIGVRCHMRRLGVSQMPARDSSPILTSRSQTA